MLHKTELRVALEKFYPRLFQLGIVVGIDTVGADHFAAVSQELSSNMKTNEARSPGHQYFVVRHRISGSEPPQFDDGGLCGTIKLRLDVEYETRAVAQQAMNKPPATVDIGLMRDGENDGICGLQRVQLGQRHPILMPRICSVRQQIMDL